MRSEPYFTIPGPPGAVKLGRTDPLEPVLQVGLRVVQQYEKLLRGHTNPAGCCVVIIAGLHVMLLLSCCLLPAACTLRVMVTVPLTVAS